MISARRTIVAHGRLAMREVRLDAARRKLHGLQVMSFEQLAVRLAGGFSRPIDDENLRAGLNVHRGKITNLAVAQSLSRDFTEPAVALRLH